MSKRRSQSTNTAAMVSTIQSATTTGKNIWSILITVGVFVATIWTTQQVVNTRLSFIESEISTMKAKDVELNKQLIDAQEAHRILLQEISTRLRDMEIRFAELRTRVDAVLDSRQDFKSTSSGMPR
jgi:hypothetical protein